jgi:alpha-tubulin suppressor-like RCC1 family protein
VRAPFDVPSLGSGVTAVVVGKGRSCAVVRGGAECWGSNSSGMLGTGLKDTQNEVPVVLPGLASGVTAIAGGDVFGCAVAAGGVKCWGENGEGQLGDGSTTWTVVPVAVKDLATGAIAVAAGDHHACALLASGGVRCWGDNGHGQLGDGTTIERHTPTNATGLDHGVSAISAGGDHTCALLSTGLVKCWGDNSDGELGDGTTTERHAPVDVVGLATGVTEVATGKAYTCALTVAGGVRCWGANALGQLGNDSMTGSLQPLDVSDLASGVRAIAAGDVFACAVTVAGAVECWGTDDGDQFGR